MDFLPHEVVEHILERLDVKSLLRFKFVSKQWKSTIQCRAFQERQLMHRRQSGNPDVLLVSLNDESYLFIKSFQAMRTLVVGSSVSVRIFTPWEKTSYKACKSSCDGLICLYDVYVPNIVANPTTRWHRTFPLSTYQQLKDPYNISRANLGFGKDKINGTYKPVWLYNADELDGHNNKNATICEVFDFTTNDWRYVVPASPYSILPYQEPVYVDGSLHWLTEGDTAKVLSFDLHTETFQVIAKGPFLHHHEHSDRELVICNLDDRLCVSEKMWPNQVIWSFDQSEHKTWEKIYSIDLSITSSWLGKHRFALTPLAVVNKDKLLLCGPVSGERLVTHDPKTKSYERAYGSIYRTSAYPLCYFQSLISPF